MTRLPFTQRIARSMVKRADAVLTLCGLPDRMPPYTTHARSHRQWLASDGDATHRLEYGLGPEDVVFDVGGYRGDWAAEIAERYGSRIHVFEPVAAYYQQIESRFAEVENVAAHAFGLSSSDRTVSLAVLEDSSSQFKAGQEVEACRLRSITDFMKEQRIDRVALLKLNIEGGEYELLESLIETGMIEQFDNIQVQFHWFVPKARARMRAIQAKLQKTHALTYQYEFVWENWSAQAAA